MFRPKIPTPRPPLDLAAQLIRAYRAMVDSWAKWVEANVLSEWGSNLAAAANRPARTDASGDWIDQRMNKAATAWADVPQQSVQDVAFKVQQRSAKEAQGLIRAYDTAGRYQGKRAKRTLEEQPIRAALQRVSLRDIVDPKAVKGFQARNADLVSGLRKRTNARMRASLEHAQEQGWRVEQLRKHLAEELGIASSKADLIARDQVLKLNGDLAEERQRQAGITRYEWSTSGDEKVRDMHADLNGTIQSWDDPPVTNEQGDTNHPGQDVSCRCVAIPLLEELGQ